MQLIKLVVELSNHLLDVSAFLFSVDLLEDSDLHILFREETLLHQRVERLLLKHILDLSVPIPSQLSGVCLVHLVHNLRVQQQRSALHLILPHRLLIVLTQVLLVLVSCIVSTSVAAHLRCWLLGHLLVLGQRHPLRRGYTSARTTLLEHLLRLLLLLLQLLDHLRWQF